MRQQGPGALEQESMVCISALSSLYIVMPNRALWGSPGTEIFLSPLLVGKTGASHEFLSLSSKGQNIC